MCHTQLCRNHNSTKDFFKKIHCPNHNSTIRLLLKKIIVLLLKVLLKKFNSLKNINRNATIIFLKKKKKGKNVQSLTSFDFLLGSYQL